MFRTGAGYQRRLKGKRYVQIPLAAPGEKVVAAHLRSLALTRPKMISAKQLADLGYKTFSSSMLLLSIYGGYLLSNGVYQTYQRNKRLKEQGINADDTKQ